MHVGLAALTKICLTCARRADGVAWRSRRSVFFAHLCLIVHFSIQFALIAGFGTHTLSQNWVSQRPPAAEVPCQQLISTSMWHDFVLVTMSVRVTSDTVDASEVLSMLSDALDLLQRFAVNTLGVCS